MEVGTAGIDPRWTAAGPAGAPLVVFVHPTRLNRTFWTPQVEALSVANRTLAVDLPGHGKIVVSRQESRTVIMSDPIRFTKENIDQFDFGI
jgi:pimeloyl-ACP methyl ester carboxylesterase